MKTRVDAEPVNHGHSISIEHGMPPFSFYSDAWGDEPLTTLALTNADIAYSLPFGDEQHSLIAKNPAGVVVGQCSTNAVVTYWNHVNALDSSTKNKATQTFVKIHQMAAQLESEYAASKGYDIQASAHNAGIAVLPTVRRQQIATNMTKQQIEECKAAGNQALFAETTNHKSAGIMKKLGFFRIKSFPYQDLAKEINNDSLNKLEGDSFTVWCRKL